jgi:HAD superfamily phosphatase
VILESEIKIHSADCALFDVDGVLIDVKKSYNIAIKKTVDFVIRYITGQSHLTEIVSDELILKFKQTGSFNNEIDISYAIVVALLSMPFNKSTDKKGARFLFKVAEKADESGMASVEKYLSSLSSFQRIQKLKDLLVYPAPVEKSILTRVFDEFFYGPMLFEKQHKIKPKHYFGKPLIENDKVLVSKNTMNQLSKKFDHNLAIVSGRSRIAAEYSLESIFNCFNQNACVFLEDEKREHWKPDPYSVNKAMKYMNAKSALYIGDSVEDLLMIRKAEKVANVEISFIGVYGSSVKPVETITKFKERGVNTTIKNVNQLPYLLK